MRHRGITPQTNWLYPPMFRTGFTGGSAGATWSVGQTYPYSGPLVLGVTSSTVPTILDFTTMGPVSSKVSAPMGTDEWSPNPIGHRVMMQADGDNIYMACGDSIAALGTIAAAAVTGVTGVSYGAGALNPFTAGGGTVGGGTTGCMKLVKDVVYGPFELPLGSPPMATAAAQPAYDNADYAAGRYSPARYLAAIGGVTGVSVYLRIWPVSD